MKRIKFWILISLCLLLQLADGLLTYINTPDLSKEGNILVTKFGLGWGALATANIIAFVFVFVAAHYSYFKYQTIYTKETKFTAYCSQIVYDRHDLFWKGFFIKHFSPLVASFGFAYLYMFPVHRAILVFEWLCTTFDVSWKKTYSYFNQTLFFGKIEIFIGSLIFIICIYFWFYKEFKKQLPKK